MFDLVSFGHTTIDFYFQGSSFTQKEGRFFLALGGKYFAEKFLERVGGGGANVAIGVSRHGLKAALVSDISGKPFNSIIKLRLNQEGVDLRFCREDKNEINLSCILLSSQGEKTVISYETPNKHFVEKERFESAMNSSENFYFGNLQEVPLKERIALLRKLKKKNKVIFSNLGVKDCRAEKSVLYEYLDQVDFIIQNVWEFSDIVGVERGRLELQENLLKKFSRFKGKIIVITDGENGSWAYTEDKVYHQPAIKPKRVLDTTGAGDAYTAGFISGMIKFSNIAKAMQIAAEYSAYILEKIGAN